MLSFFLMKCRDLISWKAMISSFAQHGRWVDALLALSQLIRTKEWPNYTTFASVLTACTGPETIFHVRMVRGSTE